MGERVPDGTTPPQSGRSGESALDDYAALETVLSATPRGRWFLSEYARQNRRAETGMLLGAMSKLEAAVLEEQGRVAFQYMLSELAEIGDVIARMRGEIAKGDETVVTKLTETLHSIEQRITALIEVYTAGGTEAKTDGPDPSQPASNETASAANLTCCQT
jgi:hypothetical protein